MISQKTIPPLDLDGPRGPAVNLIWGRPPMEDPPPLTRALTPEGLYELRTDPAATYVAITTAEDRRPASAGRTVYVTENVNEGYYPKTPKAPASLLRDVVALFRATGQIEAHINFVYDRRKRSHELYSTQIEGSATGGRVDYLHIPHTQERFVVAELHSHHHMAAFFSKTDDQNEVRSGVYGVIGHTDGDLPDLAMRYSCGGIFRRLSAAAVFTPDKEIADIVQEVRPRCPGQNP